MDTSRPQYLYEYVTAHVAQLILRNCTLRWSAASLLNDPFDVQFDLHVEVDRETLRALSLDKMLGRGWRTL